MDVRGRFASIHTLLPQDSCCWSGLQRKASVLNLPYMTIKFNLTEPRRIFVRSVALTRLACWAVVAGGYLLAGNGGDLPESLRPTYRAQILGPSPGLTQLPSELLEGPDESPAI